MAWTTLLIMARSFPLTSSSRLAGEYRRWCLTVYITDGCSQKICIVRSWTFGGHRFLIVLEARPRACNIASSSALSRVLTFSVGKFARVMPYLRSSVGSSSAVKALVFAHLACCKMPIPTPCAFTWSTAVCSNKYNLTFSGNTEPIVLR